MASSEPHRIIHPIIRAIFHELWYFAATNDVDITIRHKPVHELVYADMLSCVELSKDFVDGLNQLIAKEGKEPIHITAVLTQLPVYM